MSAARGGVVGVLPALGSGLADLRRTGQHQRLLHYDLCQYARVFDRIYYFSYFPEALEEFTRDPVLLDRVRVLPRRRPWPRLVYALLLPILHRRHFRQCQVLRVMQFNGVLPALVARWLFHIPFAVTYGYHYGEVARLAGSSLKPRLYGWLERLAFPRAAAVLVTSPEMEAILRARAQPPRLECFPNGVDVAEFAPTEVPLAGEGIHTVLYVGRMEREKNVGGLIDALARLRGLPVRLVALGDGSLRGALAAQARRAGVSAEFPGAVAHSELPRHLRVAQAFVLPSFTEGHPKALIEAMAMGLPCAASRRGGVPTLLEHEVSGLLFEPDDPAGMAAAIHRLLADAPLARRLGASAREAAVRGYDARRILDAEARFVRSLGRAPTRRSAALFEDYAQRFPIDEVLPEYVAARLRELAQAGPRAVLDLGAGDGRYLGLFAPLLPPGARLVGVEISFLRAQRIRAKGFRVMVARSEALPFKAGVFDLVNLIEVIEHTQSPGTSLDEIGRVLGPGGRLVLTTPNYPMKRLFDVRAAVRQRSWRRLRDDPTHISPLSAGRLERLLRSRFASVFIEGTAIPGEGWLRWLGRLRRSWLGRRLSNKLFALCAKSE